MGIIDPFDPDTPSPHPTATSTATPSPAPTSKRTEVFQDKITNPISMVSLTSAANTSGGYTQQANYWVLQMDKSGSTDENCLVRIAQDTEKGRSESDNLSPHRVKVINVETGAEIALHNATCLRYVENVVIGEYKGSLKKVYDSEEYNPRGQFLALSNEALSPGSAQILMINPNELEGKKDQVYAHVIYNKCNRPVAIDIDAEYVWWAECKDKGYVYRMAYTERPDRVEDDRKIRPFVSGVNFPLNIDSNGGNVYLADTKNNAVMVAKRSRGKDEPSSGLIYPQYGYNEDWGMFVLSGPMKQPYALRVLSSGKLLIADNGYNPFFESGTDIHSTGSGTGRLLIWDCPCGSEVSEHTKLGTTVQIICDGLTNPMDIVPTYDASADFTKNGKNAQVADVLISQYNESGTDSKIALKRVRLNYNKYTTARLLKGKDVVKTDRTTWTYLPSISGLPIESTTDNVQELPKDQDVKLLMMFNQKVNNKTNYDSVITLYEDKYPF